MLYKIWSIRPKCLPLDVKTFKNRDEILLTISQSRPVWTSGVTFGIEQIQPLGQAGRPPSLGQDREGIQQTSEEQSQRCRQQARMVVGALIVKHVEKLSDEKTIQAIQENPYMQYLLGLEKSTGNNQESLPSQRHPSETWPNGWHLDKSLLLR